MYKQFKKSVNSFSSSDPDTSITVDQIDLGVNYSRKGRTNSNSTSQFSKFSEKTPMTTSNANSTKAQLLKQPTKKIRKKRVIFKSKLVIEVLVENWKEYNSDTSGMGVNEKKPGDGMCKCCRLI